MSGTDPLAALRELCRGGAVRARDPRLRTELEAVGRQLDRPLQLAVAGAVSAGKSTLINAMLRRSVAPADAGECTRLVTWYEHGERDGVVLVECVDGSVRRLALQDGRLPADLGVGPSAVLRLRVQLDDPALRTVTIIDTPGVNTVSAENEEATRRLLFGDAAAEHAQALLYVLRYVQRFDADTLEEFRALSAACGMTAVNTAAVLTQIDRRGDGDEDPWPTARRLVAKASADLGGRVLDVAPVIGLLAETARGNLLGPAEVGALRELAALPPDELDDLLLDLDEFTGADGGEAFGPVDLPTRAVLVARLHRYGIREAVARLRKRPATGPAELHRWLAGCSGYGADVSPESGTVVWEADSSGPELPRTLADVLDRFARHAGRLKAFAAVVRLRGLTRREVDPADAGLVAELREAVDENRPVVAGLRGLRILAACAALGRGQLRLDEQMTAELMRLARFDDPAAGLGLPLTCTAADVVAAAGEASRRWRRVVALAGPTVGGQRARDVLGALEDIAAAALATAGGVPVPAPVPVAPVTVPDPTRLHRRPGWTGIDPDRLDALAASPLLGDPERAAVVRLRESSGPGDAAEPGSAAVLAARFRVLLHRPLPVAERRAVQAVCAALEAVALDRVPEREGAVE
ncbi:dynamin family protein [Pseudonocardia sp. KRD-184]|uniref:Dynamin family protein n=1 Tax=Pseudonocardia oceani TaxID=2792013 RepID=A0ABS6UJG0_9PSEU|nr:dynamin family protein [Pseudonocardia oceani]MBW0092599.1 dynamin family protein [Pseudonocardia oceani]MBW0099480.1 dynamin family protein [Pseudonocardia oceani]MBW0112023.1 dynamin family protein [Pseudonocardia oceani]MBW0124883.1 dynamin family protein [Pseudonocardia oceani]MBW0132028.1 dynamin family protein [Pseudonocardia oceani]